MIESERSDVSGGKVLVVDDNEIELAVVRVVLEAAGFEVATLGSVFDLTVSVRRDRPDVILLDVMMPALSGDRVAAILKQYGFSRDIPVILHSSTDETKLRKIAEATGVADYVCKTGDFELLVEKVRRAVSGRT